MADKKKLQINCKKFSCEICYFTTSDKQNYSRHLLTAKHKRLTCTAKKLESKPEFKCECGKSYMQRQSLFKHKKICTYIEAEDEKEEVEEETVTVTKEEKETVIKKKEDGPDYKELLILAMTQMQEQQTQMQRKDDLVSEAMTEMSAMRKENNQLVTQNNELVTKMTDMIPKMTEMMPSINNTNSNNTTNNTFNLQFFLNETCKDALNLTDFINSLQLQLKDLEYTANNGHIKGITHIFQTALSNMEENKRPMHCTDLKREIMYIKENDEWNKDDEKAKMKGTINQITNKNIGNIEEWLEKYPGHINPNSPDFDKFVKMTSNCMGTGNAADDDKIVRNVMREVTIDKNKESE